MFYFYLVKKYNFKNKETLLNTGLLYCWWVTMEKKERMCFFLQVMSLHELCMLYKEIMKDGGVCGEPGQKNPDIGFRELSQISRT